ncbi:hypothetical protein RND71_010992 [Anisodus tanguticus]|uniref:Bulb-type lectin domain-containing protein n=1 Tax=Anisodus tanguticus TaxID=243964 RepID=A0AAE1SKL0_9SOLA|nr:hypothetical protein RND71_010992 [Anisodus tanguticus]
MGFSFILFIVTLLLSCLLVHCGPLSYQPLTPNFTASFLNFVDTSGAFLSSPNGTFKAAITNIKSQERSYYFVIIHSDSHVVVWSANRNLPVSDSAELRLSVGGLALFDDSGDPIWSTKPFHSRNTSTTSLQLLETGNLVLVDDLNSTVWESFDFPTDTVVLGQRLPIRKSLISSVKEDELAEGDYDFFVADNDAMLKWNEMTYWKLTMEAKAFRDTNTPVEYMTIKSNGLFLLGANGTDIAIQVVLEELKSPDFRIAKLEDNGHFSVKRFSERNWLSEFNVPSDSCRVAFTCKKLGVCCGGRCSCPPGFRISSEVNGSCAPTDRNLVMPVSCNASLNANITELGNRVSYLRLENGMDYFANDFTEAKMHGVNLSVCQDFCSKNCSCLGVFHDQSSGSCYMIENILGSILRGSDSDRLGYIKVFSKPSSFDPNDNSGDDKSRFPVVALVLLPSSGVLFIIVVTAGIIWLVRRKKLLGNSGKKFGRADSSSSAEFDNIFILGLPVKFDNEEIRVATEDFRTQIGSGGFGTVYKANQPIYFPLFALEMHLQKKYMELVDPRVLGRVKSEEVQKLVRVALCCLHQEPTLRPTMANVVGMLEGVLPLGEPQVQSLNFLRFYGRRFTEASIIEGDQEVNVFELHQQNRNLSSNSSSSYNSFSYMSSQQVSGPR